jgi:hypothetical protein
MEMRGAHGEPPIGLYGDAVEPPEKFVETPFNACVLLVIKGKLRLQSLARAEQYCPLRE